MRRALIVVAALALLASGCTSSSRSAGDISLVEGQLERLDDDGWVLVSHAADGDRVRAVTDSRLQVDGEAWRRVLAAALEDGLQPVEAAPVAAERAEVNHTRAVI